MLGRELTPSGQRSGAVDRMPTRWSGRITTASTRTGSGRHRARRREAVRGCGRGKPLTSEAILGLDFLCRHDAVIKVEEKQLTLGGYDCVLPLSEANSLSSSSYLPIRAVETIEVPPYSEMDVMATVEQPAAGV